MFLVGMGRRPDCHGSGEPAHRALGTGRVIPLSPLEKTSRTILAFVAEFVGLLTQSRDKLLASGADSILASCATEVRLASAGRVPTDPGQGTVADARVRKACGPLSPEVIEAIAPTGARLGIDVGRTLHASLSR